jgi:DNA-binding CsgD family transcriptional regulator
LVRASRSRFIGELLLPRGISGGSADVVAVLCAAAFGLVFAVDTMTPEAVVSSVSLLPLLLGCWLLSEGWSLALWTICATLFIAAIVVEPSNRVTLVSVGVPALTAGLLTRSVARHQALLSAAPARPAATTSEGLIDVSLTRRERQVAGLAAQAYTAAEIGRQLNIGERTVESHLANAYSKLGITSKRELIRLAANVDAR